ncbi:MAG: phosphoribosyltransferase, partial [Pseudomonadota bacterium]
LDTLIHELRLKKRHGTPYYLINKWRCTVEKQQKSAVKMIKRYRPVAMRDLIAEQLIEANLALMGPGCRYVTNVACGHGGENCFARELAQAVARKLRIEFIDVFERLPVKGTSHPKTNKDRPKMKLVKVPRAPILLIDDVATSGSHIQEAAAKLKQHNCTVLPIAWCGP